MRSLDGSFASSAANACSTRSRFAGSRQSMKSTTTSPERSRRRICRAASRAASRSVSRAVSSRDPRSRRRPEFTSIVHIASVSWITSDAPPGSGTDGSSSSRTARSIPCAWKSGTGPACALTSMPGADPSAARASSAASAGSATTTSGPAAPSGARTASSRTTRVTNDASAWSTDGAGADGASASTRRFASASAAHSAATSSADASAMAVRATSPQPSGSASASTIAWMRARSAGSTMRRLTARRDDPGMRTSVRPGQAIWVVSVAPFRPTGSRATCTTTSSPTRTRSAMEPRADVWSAGAATGVVAPDVVGSCAVESGADASGSPPSDASGRSSAGRNPGRSSPTSTNAASIAGSTRSTRPFRMSPTRVRSSSRSTW
ncbi:MAG: hypothetical protein HMLKMBBP_01315 [Planctomycetes bacterium]|nr:hypothetical protein [Planctomycetota bacterium]